MQLLDILSGLVTEFIVVILGTLGGIALKSAYDFIRKRTRLRHMRRVFGEIEDLRGQVRFVLPKFKPMTYDDFAGGDKTFMVKDCLANRSGTKLKDLKVPMYSEVLVIDDYLAFKRIEQLFTEYGYGSLEFCDDVQALREWREVLILCFGGPRSNQKLRQIMNHEACDFITLDDSSDLLSDWTLTYNVGGKSETFNPTEETAYGFIFKMQNPNYEPGHIIAIVGDSAFSTDMSARFLSENLVRLSTQFHQGNFLIILKGDRDMYDTVKIERALVLDGE